MVTIQIFLIAVIVIYVLNLFVFLETISLFNITLLVFTTVLGMILVNGIVAFVCCKMLPDTLFSADKKIYKVSKKEISFYEKFGIKKWKDKTAELGALNGFKKNKVQEFDNPEYVKRFILETNKGFIDHFISSVVSVIVAFFMPMRFWLTLSFPVALTSVVLNLISVVILRYNMPRLQVLLKFAERKQRKESNIK